MIIKDYKLGDEIQIFELFHAAFGKPLSEVYWNWKFLNNPESKVMIKLMWDNEKLAGHYAVSPLKLNMDGEIVSTALSMATMTHPHYAGQGIFKDLAEALYTDEKQKNQLKAVWGFPNNNSHYGFVKNLKWKNIDQIPTLSVDTDKIKGNISSTFSFPSIFTENHINAQKKIKDSYKIKVEKTIAYLTWRYLENPVNKYDIIEIQDNEISYYAVMKIFPSFIDKNKFEIDVLELVFPPDYTLLLDLIRLIKGFYKKYNLLRINIWLPLNDEKHLLFEKIGFFNTFPITYSGIRVLDDKYTQLEESKEWILSMGDSDIY